MDYVPTLDTYKVSTKNLEIKLEEEFSNETAVLQIRSAELEAQK